MRYEIIFIFRCILYKSVIAEMFFSVYNGVVPVKQDFIFNKEDITTMGIKVGINGFGRIGRMVFRAGLDNENIEFLGINDPGMTPDYMAYMLRYDTMHGQYTGDISCTDNSIIVNGKEIKVFAEFKPEQIPWGEIGVEYVVESTGFFLTQEAAKGHIEAGAKKVIMSAPSKDAHSDVRMRRKPERLHQGHDSSFPTLPAPPTAWLRSLRFWTKHSASRKA